MKVALIHDWLLTQGGSEKVFSEIYKLFPGPVHTLFYEEKQAFAFEKVNSSYLQKLPGAKKYYRSLFPFFPGAIESFDLSSYDILLSSSHAVSKGVQKRDDQLHICYCYTPMRYAWDLKESYLEPFSFIKKKAASLLLERVRKWDLAVTPRVDLFIAISCYVARRIEKNYGRKADVIYPPVDVDKFFISPQKEGYYITHARLVPYKKIDLLVRTFHELPDQKLLVIGQGPEEKFLKKIAPKNVEFLGHVEEQELAILLSKAKAYLFAADEDFGIGVVEAQAAGLPVLALRKGGAMETVLDGVTGLFFDAPTPSSLLSTIKAFEKKEDTFDPALIRKHSEKFSSKRFSQEFSNYVHQAKELFYENHHSSRGKRHSTMAPF